MRYRRATSLVELLVLMSACSVILTLSAALLHRVMHIQARARTYFDAERSATRLSQQFRQDVHRALDHRTDGIDIGEGELLRLTHPNEETVQYAVIGSKVSRSLERHGAIVAREEYTFPSAVKIEVHQEVGPTRLVLSNATQLAEAPNRLSKKPLDLDSSPVSCRAEAVLGRDVRFERVSASREDSQ